MDYAWNRKESLDRKVIEAFLRIAEDRIETHNHLVPFTPQEGRLVIAWLRGLIDRKPSEMKK